VGGCEKCSWLLVWSRQANGGPTETFPPRRVVGHGKGAMLLSTFRVPRAFKMGDKGTNRLTETRGKEVVGGLGVAGGLNLRSRDRSQEPLLL